MSVLDLLDQFSMYGGAARAATVVDDPVKTLLAGIEEPAAQIRSLNVGEIARAAREPVDGFAVYGDASSYFQVGRMKATAELINDIDPSGYARATEGIAAGPVQAIEQVGAISGAHPTSAEMVRVNDAVLGWADTFASRLRETGIKFDAPRADIAPLAY